MRVLFASAALAVFIIGIVAGCSDTITDPDKDLIFPDKDVSYTRHVQPFLTLRCATSGCHDDNPKDNSLSLTSYSAFINKPGIVRKGDSDASLLIQRIDGRLPHPPHIPILVNENQLNGIKTWVDEGAEYN